MFDYKSATEWPCFNVNFALYPDEHQQVSGGSLPVDQHMLDALCADEFPPRLS